MLGIATSRRLISTLLVRFPRQSSSISFNVNPSSPHFNNHLHSRSFASAGMAEVQANDVKVQQEPAPSPPLSDKDFRFYNSLADKMEYFHNHFREMWKVMWDACESGRRPKNMSLRQFLNHAEDFVHYLETHHSIEERVLYPRLAPRLKHFDPKNGDLVVQHKEIHRGMDALEAYIKDCKSGRADFSLAVLKEKLETWGDVLWSHLDEEVAALGAEHMHKVFTKEEFSRIPI